jgi:two-component system, cell cycle response regulator DivK
VDGSGAVLLNQAVRQVLYPRGHTSSLYGCGSILNKSEVTGDRAFNINFIANADYPVKPSIPAPSQPRPLPFCRRNASMLGDPTGPAPKTVLIVEDNELNLKLLNDLLEHQGYRVIATRLGEPSLGLAQQHHPDLILMDIQLPDLSGMEATRRLKKDEQTRAIPIIAVTAFAMPGDEASILASGCDAYVPKPFRVMEFLRLVERWTSGARSNAS